jgi:hypothetical protein
MQYEGETLELQLATHFPSSVVTKGMVISAAAQCTIRCNWQVAAEFLPCGRVERAINYFVQYKSPGMYGTFPALLQEG